MIFFTGMHDPHNAAKVEHAFISAHRLERRRSGFPVGKWIQDCGGFTTIMKHGGYPKPPEDYARLTERFASNGMLLAAVTQDFMCEPHMLERTKARAVAEQMRRRGLIPVVDRAALVVIHQRWTVKRYDRIRAALRDDIYLMPVLQGYEPAEYVAHIAMYGDRLAPGAWVGVGSVCKRNGDPAAIEDVLLAIAAVRPDLRLHGFGVKTTALASGLVQSLLYSADSMAWSLAARKQGRDGNSPDEAIRFGRRIATMPVQESMIGRMVPGKS